MPQPPQGSTPRLSLDRRELLKVAGALVAVLSLPDAAAGQSAGIGLDAFQDLTRALTGHLPADRSIVPAFRDAFAADLDRLAQLHDILRDTAVDDWQAAIDRAGLADLAEALILAWYTGSVGEGGTARVVTYLDAFVWHAVGYTKPPSACDTAFGAWASRPVGDY